MVAGIAMCKDEADIIARSVGWMRSQVDLVIVADNGSTDGTREILETMDVTVVDDPEVGYYQSRKMTGLAQRALELGATWVVPFDADELHVAHEGRIADTLEQLPANVLVSEAPLFDHVATGHDRALDDPVLRLRWRRCAQAPLRKVACRARWDLVIHQGNHGASYGNDLVTMVNDRIEVRHFPYRSPEQMVRKAINGKAAYDATDLSLEAGKHWRDYGRLVENGGPEALHDVFRQWFWVADPENDPNLAFDPCRVR